MSNTPKEAPDNPFEPSEAHLQRIRERAYHLWEQEGRPEGRAEEYWERARELDAIASYPVGLEENPITARPAMPPGSDVVEQAALEENLGEFPGRFTDQGDAMPTPTTRKRAKAFREGER